MVESGVRALSDSRSEAIWLKDIERLMSFYSPDIVYRKTTGVVMGGEH